MRHSVAVNLIVPVMMSAHVRYSVHARLRVVVVIWIVYVNYFLLVGMIVLVIPIHALANLIVPVKLRDVDVILIVLVKLTVLVKHLVV